MSFVTIQYFDLTPQREKTRRRLTSVSAMVGSMPASLPKEHPKEQFIIQSSVLQLALKVIAGFSPHLLSAERRIGPGCIQRPPEAQYQDEFYRSCHAFSHGSLLTLPEYGTAEGRVDFYVPSKKWDVELLRDGNRLEEHSGRFSESGPYARTLPLSDYILLDCRKMRPRRRHSRMCIICPSIHFSFCEANLTHRHSKFIPRCIQQ